MNTAASARSEQRRNFILEGNLTKVIFITALPQVITMIIDSLYNITDTFFVSQLGEAAIAAVGINDSLMMLIRAVAMGFGIGASSFISRSLGAKKDEEASKAAVTTLFTAVGFMSVLAVLGSIFLVPLVDFLGATDSVRPHSMQFARWILVSAPVTACTVCLSQTLRSEGSTTYAMVGSVSGCVINIGLTPLFIQVLGLGIAGAAIATGISKLISAFILLSPFVRRKSVIVLRLGYFAPTRALYGELAKMGIPTVIRTGMMSVSTILINNVASGFGDVALAAISVANKSLRLMGSAVMGFGQGFQPIAGYSWGAKKYDRVLKGFRYIIAIGATIGLTLGTLITIFAKQVIEVFSADPNVLEIGMILIRTQGIVLPLHVSVMITTGLFQALGKPFRAGIMGLSRQLLSLIPSVLILSYLFGVTGLACSQAASDIVSFTIAVLFLIPTLKQIMALNGEQLQASVVMGTD